VSVITCVSCPRTDTSLDAPDFYHSTIFDPSPSSGVGGWGDPNNDFQITDGGFNTDFLLSYPLPHRLRRNFTLQFFLDKPLDVFGDGSTSIHWDTDRMLNLSFTKKSQDDMVNAFVGDFAGFQTFIEGSNVSDVETMSALSFAHDTCT
jgi:tyrosinase